ncbi:MAG: hypothetical protein WC107_00135 [Patescibacteria group bacterium]
MVFSTQQAIDIAGIKDGIIILKDGSYRIVLQVAAANFNLKSEAEQNSIVFQYQGFLNSLHFPIEIIIRSKQLDLAPYLKKLTDIAKSQGNELLKAQTDDYIDFIGELITMANIMKKNFYVVVSYQPMAIQQSGLFDKLFKPKKATIYDHIKITDQEFETNAKKIMERGAIVAQGLGSMGLHCFQLSTEQLIELFYQVYNPDEASKERIEDAVSLASPIIIAASETKKKMKVADAAETENDGKKSQEELDMIDNSNVVLAQRKIEQEERLKAEAAQAESSKSSNGQTSSSQTKDTPDSPTPGKTGPAVPVADDEKGQEETKQETEPSNG